jgi:hypothetical protein
MGFLFTFPLTPILGCLYPTVYVSKQSTSGLQAPTGLKTTRNVL